ncbi:arginine ABC transporter substrate-binding protein [Pragia fontium]|uniref:Arginine transport system substrate-binding protein n=2 Tax=Pragia fontium TaxID=82985 RepID=A0AAJ4WBU2_9GAMM|nr:arginine ABC transporter substrate-binding protein [Pragia fontium]GKX62660.1 arginine ABC transporter substrate-binding protein [Pragia fontium]SFD10481.1 arginine transport system substrate-binding protein [Pragia fontium DSM 5563 = ATCC 49100]VEJ55730.1 Putative ABC transporter arginine-binding protein 2 precursor [Pragia fontium]
MKKLLVATLLASISLSAAAAEKIRFATEASYPPFEFIDANNQIQGFDIDLANALCKEIKAECTFSNQSFDSLVPGLKFRRFEAAIAAMDVTPERQQQVTFTNTYYDNSAQFIAMKGKVADLAALKGQKVGMQNGSTHQKYLLEKHTDIKPVAYDSYQNAILDLKSGRINAVFGDTAVVAEWLKKNDDLASVGEKVTDNAYFGTGFAIALNQKNTDLRDKMNAALEKIKQDGTYKAIYDKWFQK